MLHGQLKAIAIVKSKLFTLAIVYMVSLEYACCPAAAASQVEIYIDYKSQIIKGSITSEFGMHDLKTN